MNDTKELHFSNSVIAVPLLFVLSLWVVFWLEVKLGIRFSNYGIYPQQLSGLRGVLLSPFIHGDIAHLYNNSLPLLVLLAALRYFYKEDTFWVIGLGIISSGLITWIIGRPSYHIGASGLIYVLVSFIFFKGVKSKHYRLVALSLFVVMVYGGLVWYIFPSVQSHISWEGHLGGFITGFVFSFIFKSVSVNNDRKYEWEQEDYDPSQDRFMQHFDEKGNFIELPEQTTTGEVEVTYDFKPKETED
ncbi:MAG: rhomboid family intramembrane serine protease [Flavobacteriales bacterium]|nr:rhomboid family intramembrane serine protease [Flavobacteriales bacterium]